jgi:hypothetical protein
MHDRGLLNVMHEQILKKKEDYAETNPCELRLDDLSQQYSRLCRRIGALEGEAILPAALRKSIITGEGWVARLQLTCKTHKPAGK